MLLQSYKYWGDPDSIVTNDTLFAMITAIGEFIGMFIFMFFLIGTVLNLKLSKSFAHMKSPFGWIVLGISLGLLAGLFASYGFEYSILSKEIDSNKVNEFSNSLYLNLNPVFVLIGLLKGIKHETCGYIPLGNGMLTMIFEFLGSFLASFMAYLFFKRLIKQEEDAKMIRGCFYTGPSYHNRHVNIFNEGFSTFIFVIVILLLGSAFQTQDQAALKIITIAAIVGAMGYGIGGVTGYALNPFRDLCPRIVYAIVMHKQDPAWKEDWTYSYIPIVGPIVGGILAAIIMPGFLY